MTVFYSLYFTGLYETELLQVARAVRSNRRLKHVFGVLGPRPSTYLYVMVRLIILFPLVSHWFIRLI